MILDFIGEVLRERLIGNFDKWLAIRQVCPSFAPSNFCTTYTTLIHIPIDFQNSDKLVYNFYANYDSVQVSGIRTCR